MIIDTQSAKNAATATGATVGSDAGKLVKSRKRLVLIDTLGNVLASRVVLAHVSDAAAAVAFWDEVATAHPLLAEVALVLGDNLPGVLPTTWPGATAYASRSRCISY